jgi:ABC-2 type transport system permease protein
MIAAIVRAQWLCTRRLAGRRGALFTAVASLIWYGAWTGAAVAAGVAAASADPRQLHDWLPVALLGVFAYWQAMPVLSVTMGAALDLRKLLVYPVPHRKLLLIEVLLRLTNALEMTLVLAGGSIGLLANPALGGRALPRLAAAIVLFVLMNLLLSSGVRSLLERLLSRRRLREVLAFVTMMLAVTPRLWFATGHRGMALGRAGRVLQAVALPWTATARAVLGETEWTALASLAAWTLVAAWFGRAQFERRLRYDPLAAQATPLGGAPRASVVERFYRLPSLLFRDPLAAIVEKELRSLARTPRFRTVFIMGFTFGLAVWFPTIAMHGGASPRPPWFLAVVCLYALVLLGQVSYWNCFGFDRSAVAFYFAAPQPMRQVLAGKNLAAAIYIYLEVAIVAAVTTALRLNSGWGNVLETLAAMGICALYLLAIGNLSSVHYPRALSAERVGAGGGRGMQGFLFLVYPLALVPVGMAYLARYAFDSEWAFALILAGAAVLGGALYGMAMETAVHTATARREQLLAALTETEGPVSS